MERQLSVSFHFLKIYMNALMTLVVAIGYQPTF